MQIRFFEYCDLTQRFLIKENEDDYLLKSELKLKLKLLYFLDRNVTCQYYF